MDTNCFSPKPLRNAMQKAVRDHLREGEQWGVRGWTEEG